MADMPHWNAFVKRMLSEKQDKPDNDKQIQPLRKLPIDKKEGEEYGKIDRK